MKKNCHLPTYMLSKPTFIAVMALAFCNLFLVEDVRSQDPTFSQFYANPLYLNPAMAGTNKCPRAVVNYRNQWPALTGNFVTYSASYDQYVDAVSGGLGLHIMQDHAGQNTLRTLNISGVYSYQLALSSSVSMIAGFQATYFQKDLDWSSLTFGDMIDPRRGFIYETQDKPRGDKVDNVDFSSGLLVFSETFYGGVAVHHLFEPNESLTVEEAPLERKYTVHAGANFPIKKDIKGETDTYISPNVLYQRQFDFEQINLGLYVKRGPLIGGVWYRFNDSFIALLGVETEFFKMGYSYDLTTSNLTTKTSGSHEISVAFTFNCAPQKKKFRAIKCPAF